LIAKIIFAHSLKNLQATLEHLTWQANQIAEGDFTQRTDFLGEFSKSFNWMVEQLDINRNHLEKMIEERTKELSLLLETTMKTSQAQDLDEILHLFSEMLIHSFPIHSYCRVSIVDKSKQFFEIKAASSIRPLGLDDVIGEVFPLSNFKLLEETLRTNRIGTITNNNDMLDDDEKYFLFQGRFKTVLIIPFQDNHVLLGFALLCEARDPKRSDFKLEHIDFYKTLSNHLSTAINNALLFTKNKNIFLHTIEALAAAVDARDAYTHYHSRNVMRYAVRIAEGMGFSITKIEKLKTACLLHDIGKIGIKDEILLKPGKLTNEEIEEIKTHPQKANSG